MKHVAKSKSVTTSKPMDTFLTKLDTKVISAKFHTVALIAQTNTSIRFSDALIETYKHILSDETAKK